MKTINFILSACQELMMDVQRFVHLRIRKYTEKFKSQSSNSSHVQALKFLTNSNMGVSKNKE
jgi:hypothetical protein